MTLSAVIDAENKALGLTDANKGAEDFFCSILNILHSTQLKNLNITDENYPGLDLGDEKKQIGFQITSEVTSAAIKKKLGKLVGNKVHNTFKTIYFLLLKKKKDYRTRFTVDGYTLSTNSIIDIHDLIREIRTTDKAKLDRIHELVIEEITLPTAGTNIPAIASARSDDYLKDLEISSLLRDNYNSIDALAVVEKFAKEKWMSYSSIQRYKLLVTKGLCYLDLHKEKNGAKEFVRAFKYNPKSDKALGFRALGHALLNQKAAAVKFIDQTLKKNKLNEDAYCAIIINERNNLDFDQVLLRIPAALQRKAQVAYALGYYALSIKNLEQAIIWFKKALQLGVKRKADIRAALGAAIIESKANSFNFITRQYDLETIKSIKDGINYLDAALDEIKSSQAIFKRSSWLINRAIGKKLIQKNEDALHDLAEAHSLSPKDFHVARHYAIGLFENEKIDQAHSVLRQCKQLRPKDVTLDLMIAEVDYQRGEFAPAIESLKTFLSSKSKDTRAHAEARVLLVECLFKSEAREDALIKCEEFIKNSSDPLRLMLMLSTLHERMGQAEQASRLIDDAKTKVNEHSSQEDIHDLAKRLFKRNEFQASKELLLRIVKPNVYSSLSRLLIQALINCGEYNEAFTICENLRASYGDQDSLIDIEAYIFTQQLRYSEAISVCKSFLTTYPENQIVTFRLCQLYFETREHKNLKSLLPKINSIETQSFDLRFRVAQYHLAVEDYSRALEIAYEARRDNFSLGEAHRYFFGIQIGIPNDKVTALLEIEQVTKDCVVTILHKGTESTSTYLLTDRNKEDLRSDELSIKEAFASALLGAKVGDTIDQAGQTYEIQKIVHKYVAAFHESTQLLSTVYAQLSGFKTFNLRTTGNPRTDFKPLFDQLDDFDITKKRQDKFYVENIVPIGAMAKFMRQGVVKTWHYLIREENAGIFAIWHNNEINVAQQKLHENFGEVIIDLTSLLYFFSTEKLKLLEIAGLKFSIVQASINELTLFIDELEEAAKRGGFFTVGKHRGDYVREEITKESLEDAIKAHRGLIDWLKTNVSVIPSPSEGHMPINHLERLRDVLGRSFLDTILLAKEKNLVLLSDDSRLRMLSYNEHRVTGMASYHLLALLRSMDRITQDEFDVLVTQLITFNHRNIPVSANILWQAAEKSLFKIAPPLTRALESLGFRVSDPGSSVSVAVMFLKTYYLNMPVQSERQKMVGRVITILCEGRKADQVINLLIRIVRVEFHLLQPQMDNLLQIIQSWRQFLSRPRLASAL